jgi:hypothetical protein
VITLWCTAHGDSDLFEMDVSVVVLLNAVAIVGGGLRPSDASGCSPGRVIRSVPRN